MGRTSSSYEPTRSRWVGASILVSFSLVDMTENEGESRLEEGNGSQCQRDQGSNCPDATWHVGPKAPPSVCNRSPYIFLRESQAYAFSALDGLGPSCLPLPGPWGCHNLILRGRGAPTEDPRFWLHRAVRRLRCLVVKSGGWAEIEPGLSQTVAGVAEGPPTTLSHAFFFSRSLRRTCRHRGLRPPRSLAVSTCPFSPPFVLSAMSGLLPAFSLAEVALLQVSTPVPYRGARRRRSWACATRTPSAWRTIRRC